MEKQFKTAYIGVTQGDDEYGYDSIGITTFNTSAEKILGIVKDLDSTEGKLHLGKFGILPEKRCVDMYGGRSMAFYSFNDIIDIVKDVEVVIVSGTTEIYYIRAYLSFLTTSTLPKSCIVVLRMPFVDDAVKAYGASHANDLLSSMRMNYESSKKKNKKNKGKNDSRKIFVIGLEKMGGVDPEIEIPRLHSALFQEEVTEEILKPVKETVSAGKSLVEWGRSFTSWVSRLVSSN